MLEKEGASENAKRKAGDKILFLSLACSPSFNSRFCLLRHALLSAVTYEYLNTA